MVPLIKFSLKTDTIELYQLLKVVGLASTGGMAKQAIKDKAVKVDGRVEVRKACKVRKGSKVEYDGSVIELE